MTDTGVELPTRSDRQRVAKPTPSRHDNAPTTPSGPRSPTGLSVAMIGTYPPTACGLATFTSNLRLAITEADAGWVSPVVRVLDREEQETSSEVVAHWLTGDEASLRRSLRALESVDAVMLQHEFGLFGGADGSDVLALADGLTAPLITVLHTVVPDPSRNQRRIVDRLIERSAVVVAQSACARAKILQIHGADPDHVVTIPHGAVENTAGPVLPGVAERTVLSWGLLSPGKGIEHGIRALAALDPGLPPAHYVVAGRTHPKVQASQGQQYRLSLEALARSLGVSDRVCLDDGYRDWDSLRALVRSAAVVLIPYDSRDQVSSGVLVEAVASGKPVVATRFPHAEELLGSGAGLLVDQGDTAAMTEALRRVLYEPGLADRMGGAARRAARPLLWPAVGSAYRILIANAVKGRVG